MARRPDLHSCPTCRTRYAKGRVLNAAEVALDGTTRRIAACASCLTVTRFDQHLPRLDDDWTVETIASGGETAHFLEHLRRAAEDGAIGELHAAASSHDRDRWLLRLPDALPLLRPHFVSRVRLLTDTFGEGDAVVGCLALESLDRLLATGNYEQSARSPDEVVHRSFRHRVPVFRAGFEAVVPAFPRVGRLPPAVSRAICIAVAPVDPGAAYRLVAVPPDLAVPIA